MDRNVFVNENSSNMAESYDSSKSTDSSVLNDAGKTNKPTLMFVNRSFGVPPRLPVRDTTKFSEDLASVAGCQSPDANSNSDTNAFQFFQKGNSFRRNSQVTIRFQKVIRIFFSRKDFGFVFFCRPLSKVES